MSATAEPPPGNFNLAGRTVLVVEDHPHSRHVLKDVLTDFRVRVYTARNIQEVSATSQTL